MTNLLYINLNQPVIQKELYLQQLQNKFLPDRSETRELADCTWSDYDIQSVHAQDEYEAVADVLEQRGYVTSKLDCSNAKFDWSAYD